MNTRAEISVGSALWSVEIDPTRQLTIHRAARRKRLRGSPREQVQEALEHPFQFEPLRRALTPDDQITVVLDETLPEIAELVNGVLDHVVSAGVEAGQITLLSRAGASDDWVDSLSDDFADVKTVTHHPEDAKTLAYLATTRAGRRIYLNRTLVEADFAVLITPRRYDPLLGYMGAECAIFPNLSDEESQKHQASQLSFDVPSAEPNALRAESIEIAWLLGSPFFVQVIEDASGGIDDIVAGLATSSSEGIRRQDALWRGRLDERPDLVVVSFSPTADAIGFADLAAAAAAGARVVNPGGRVVLLAGAVEPSPASREILRRFEAPDDLLDQLEEVPETERTALFLWASAARVARLSVTGCSTDEEAEEIFATSLVSESELQRLLDNAPRFVMVPDAHRTMLEVL